MDSQGITWHLAPAWPVGVAAPCLDAWQPLLRPVKQAPHRDVFPIREYYTNQRTLPSRLLVGSRGQLVVEIKCISPNQYLGMAEDDLFIVASQGSFWANYLRGLTGIWLQALILTAIGVFAGTFLSWPVALLATVAFFVAGNVAFETLQQFALSERLVGGGLEFLPAVVGALERGGAHGGGDLSRRGLNRLRPGDRRARWRPSGALALAGLETGDQARDLGGLGLQRMGGGGGLFHHGRVLLHDLVHLVGGGVDLGKR